MWNRSYKEPNLGGDTPGKIDVNHWADRVGLDEEIVSGRKSEVFDQSIPAHSSANGVKQVHHP